MNYFNINQKFIFLEIINKFFLTKIKSYNLKLQLKFKLNFNLKTIVIHYLILKFCSFSGNIILNKLNSSTICVLTKNFSKYTLKLLSKLNIETLLNTNKLVVNKNFVVLNFKNFVILSKLEIFYKLLSSTNKFYFNFFIDGAFSKKSLIHIFRKILINI